MQINELTARIRSEMCAEGRQVVYLCGLAGTGKTTTATVLVASGRLPGSVVQLDWYLKWPTLERRARIQSALTSNDTERIEAEENPVNWYDWDQFQVDVETLRLTGYVERRDAWNQLTGTKELNIEMSVADGEFILCDGIYLLHPPVLALAEVAVLLTAPDEVARQRADARDAHRSDADYLAYKQHLVDKYDIPYMERYAEAASFAVEMDRGQE